MDMKYDSSVMGQLTEATKSRITDAYNALGRVRHSFEQNSSSDWDDEKKKEFKRALDEAESALMASFRELYEYLENLCGKMREFENRG